MRQHLIGPKVGVHDNEQHAQGVTLAPSITKLMVATRWQVCEYIAARAECEIESAARRIDRQTDC